MPDYMTLEDLHRKIGSQKIAQYFNDDGTGSVEADDPNVEDALDMAEGIAYSLMLRHYSNREQIATYALQDAGFRGHVAWIAIQMASDTRAATDDLLEVTAAEYSKLAGFGSC